MKISSKLWTLPIQENPCLVSRIFVFLRSAFSLVLFSLFPFFCFSLFLLDFLFLSCQRCCHPLPPPPPPLLLLVPSAVKFSMTHLDVRVCCGVGIHSAVCVWQSSSKTPKYHVRLIKKWQTWAVVTLWWRTTWCWMHSPLPIVSPLLRASWSLLCVHCVKTLTHTPSHTTALSAENTYVRHWQWAIRKW